MAKDKHDAKFTEYTWLNTPRSKFLLDIKHDKYLRWPKPLRTDSTNLNNNLYSRFHRDVGDDTGDYIQLKDEIEYLIRRRKFHNFTQSGDRLNTYRRDYDNRKKKHEDMDKNPSPRGPIVHTISYNPTTVGVSRNLRKAYSQKLCK